MNKIILIMMTLALIGCGTFSNNTTKVYLDGSDIPKYKINMRNDAVVSIKEKPDGTREIKVDNRGKMSIIDKILATWAIMKPDTVSVK